MQIINNYKKNATGNNTEHEVFRRQNNGDDSWKGEETVRAKMRVRGKRKETITGIPATTIAEVQKIKENAI